MISPAGIVLVDAHVHVHPQADPVALLDAAAANFALAARRLNAQHHQGVLLLTEMAGVNWFESVLPGPGQQSRIGHWTVSIVAQEDVSLQLTTLGHSLLVVAGRQIVSKERIEVLALGTRRQIADGQDLAATLGAAHRAQAIVVLPWAVGKWLGARGRLVAEALRQAASLGLHAGDNGGRPALWPAPPAFRIATSLGRAILPGTDPLPLPDQERRVGSLGFWIDGALPTALPAAALRQRLLDAGSQPPQAYGQLETLPRFVRNQLALRFGKHPSR